MCLGIPGKITNIWIDSTSGWPMARVDFGGVGKEVCLAMEPEAEVNDYVLVHVGFAISRINAEEAHQTLAILAEMDSLAEELGEAAT